MKKKLLPYIFRCTYTSLKRLTFKKYTCEAAWWCTARELLQQFGTTRCTSAIPIHTTYFLPLLGVPLQCTDFSDHRVITNGYHVQGEDRFVRERDGWWRLLQYGLLSAAQPSVPWYHQPPTTTHFPSLTYPLFSYTSSSALLSPVTHHSPLLSSPATICLI